MNLLNLIRNRRTIRKYKNKKISRDIIEEIIEAARWAPAAHNIQPWEFVAIDNANKIEQIADLLEKKANFLFSGFNIVMRDTAKNLRNAPLLLLVYSNGAVNKKFDRLGAPYSEIGNIYEIQSISSAVENILLYASSIGLGAAWCGMAVFCGEEINKFLNFTDRLMGLISLGYPNENPTPPSRKAIVDILKFLD